MARGRLVHPVAAGAPAPSLGHGFVEDRTRDGRILDAGHGEGFTREAPAIRVARRLPSTGVIDVPADLLIPRGVPERVRSDQGPGPGSPQLPSPP